MNYSKQLSLAAFLLFIAVAIGAFGAHALKELVTGKYLDTFQTGSRYHFYHGLALIMSAILNYHFNNRFLKPFYFFLAGIILFSFNCYIYAIFKAKIFAMIVPIGGISFLIGWLLFSIIALKETK